MRTDQMIGLSPKAEKLVEGFKCEVYTKFTGAWNEMVLHKYSKIEDDRQGGTYIRVYLEIIQTEPWSSGPCYFLCLIDIWGRKHGKWTQKQMEEYL